MRSPIRPACNMTAAATIEVMESTHDAEAASPPAMSSRIAGKMKYSAVASQPPTKPARTAARAAVEVPVGPAAGGVVASAADPVCDTSRHSNHGRPQNSDGRSVTRRGADGATGGSAH